MSLQRYGIKESWQLKTEPPKWLAIGAKDGENQYTVNYLAVP
jgi:hypothetical protein